MGSRDFAAEIAAAVDELMDVLESVQDYPTGSEDQSCAVQDLCDYGRALEHLVDEAYAAKVKNG